MNLFLRKIFNLIENIFGYFIVFKLRKIKTDDLSILPSYNITGSNVALILQGPIIIENDFTYETVKYYNHLYPNLKIIISTWKGVSPILEEKFNIKNVIILQNERPINAGNSNVNLQIKSTTEALLYAKQNGAKFALKSRTDQRINSIHNYLNYMLEIIENFPIKPNQIFQNRLIICNLNMFKKRHYIVSDMFMFGAINDMLLYWNIPHQLEKSEYENKKSYLENNFAEAYFVNSFLDKVNYNTLGTFEDSKLFYGNYFYILDKNVIDLFWYKYNHNYERTRVWVENQTDFPYSIIDFLPIYNESTKS